MESFFPGIEFFHVGIAFQEAIDGEVCGIIEIMCASEEEFSCAKVCAIAGNIFSAAQERGSEQTKDVELVGYNFSGRKEFLGEVFKRVAKIEANALHALSSFDIG